MIPIEDIEINGLRAAIKELNSSGLVEKIKTFGKKAEVVKKFVDTVDGIDESVKLPKVVADFYNKIFEDEIDDDNLMLDEITEALDESSGAEEPEKEEEERQDDSKEEEKPVERPADTFEAKSVKKILKTLQPATLKKSTIDQFTRFRFTGKEIMSYSGNMCVFYPFPTDFECSVKADDIVKVMDQITGDVRMTFEDNQLKLDGDIKAGFVSQYSPSFGDDINLVEDEHRTVVWKDLPSDFVKGALLTYFAAGRKEELFSNGIMVNGKDMAATDRIRLGYYEMESSMDAFFIRAKNVKYIASLKPEQYSVTDAWVYFKTKEDVVIGSRRMLGEFPSYQEMVLLEGAEDKIEIPKALSRAMKGVAVLSDEDESMLVDIKAENGKLTVSSQNERGWAVKEIDIEYEGEYEFSVDPNLMLQALRHTVNLIMYDTYVVLEAGNYKHVIAKKSR